VKDFHLHSGFLEHTSGELGQIIMAARDLGFEEIAITEHLVWLFVKKPNEISGSAKSDTIFPNKKTIPFDGRKTIDLDNYFESIERYKNRFEIKILRGLEVDYFDEYLEDIKKCLSSYNIDIILGSNHFLKCITDGPGEKHNYIHIGYPKQIDFFVKRYGKNKLYRDYFNGISRAIKSGIFDFMAHIDFLKKGFREFNYKDADFYIDSVLGDLINYNVGLEINLSGLKDVGETYPSRDIIQRYINMGGKKISIGSDSHSISRLKKMAPIIQDFFKLYSRYL
jgi:histidinol-phosphatase (PHP family)